MILNLSEITKPPADNLNLTTVTFSMEWPLNDRLKSFYKEVVEVHPESHQSTKDIIHHHLHHKKMTTVVASFLK